MELVDFLINVKPELPADQRDLLESEITGVEGVVSACFSPGHPHMLEITYNPEVVDSNAVLARLSRHGIAAGKIGM
jgi:hypothetical protein